MLKRITMATDTLLDFLAIPRAQQRILIFMLSHRSMRQRPERPTNYYSLKDIAEATELSETTVRVSIRKLLKAQWIEVISQRNLYTPSGKPETQWRWTVSKVVHELEKAYEKEVVEDTEAEAKPAATHDSTDTDMFLYEDKFWRMAPNGWWQHRKPALNGKKEDWISTKNPPQAVIDFFNS